MLSTSRLWRKVVEEVRTDFPDVDVEHRLVDACAMMLIKRPASFDVLVTENLFGDILSDEASVLAGSLGMLPSASVGERRTDHGLHGLYEPIHGSAPHMAGTDRANPIGTILSGALMLRWSLGQAAAAEAVEGAVAAALDDGIRTPDIMPADAAAAASCTAVGTVGMTEAVVGRDRRHPAGAGVTDTVLLYDTTLRDGTQREGLIVSLADKLKIARRLDEFGFPYIEGGWPGSNPKDAEFFAAARGMAFRTARLAAFGATRHRLNRPADDPNLRALVEAETPVVTIFGKSWLLHVTEVLGATAEENLAMVGDSVAHCRAAGRELVYDAEHYFDGYRDDPAYAIATLRAARSAGASTLVLCDTNGGTMTDDLSAVIDATRAALADADEPEVVWGIHVHNDAELAVANSLAAVAHGIRHVQGTINGYGERCGNANLVSILANLALKREVATVPAGDRLPELTELSRYVAEIVNIAPDDHQPYVGRSAFAHKGGVHGAAVAKVERSYQHVDPTLVGNVSRLVVSELGGKANTQLRAEQLGHQLEGVDPKELSVLIKQLESEGLAFEGAEGSFELLIRRHGAGYTPPFRVVDFTVLVEQRAGSELRAEATVKVEVDGETLHTAADGNGPVNALDSALRKALRAFYPGLDAVHLVDYKVRILDGDAATAARTRVIIDSSNGEHEWSTMGSDTNIIAASAAALAEFARIRDLEDRRRAAAPRRAALHHRDSREVIDVHHRRRADAPPRPVDRDIGIERPESGRRGHRVRRSPMGRLGGGKRPDRRPVPGRRPGAGRRSHGPAAAARLRHPRPRRGTRRGRQGPGPDRAADGGLGTAWDRPLRRDGDLDEHRGRLDRGLHRSDQQDAGRGAMGRGGRGGGQSPTDAGAASDAKARRAEIDEEAGRIDTTEWFNR